MTFKAIGFDHGGVIEPAGGKAYNKKIEDLLNITPETRREIYFKYNHLANNGHISYEELWHKILTELGLLDKYDEMLKLIHDPIMHDIDNRILDLVDNLKKNSYKVGLLSNHGKNGREKFEIADLIKHFDTVLISAEVGCSKPDPKIFKLFCKQLQVKPNELIYIDDARRSLSTAEEVGYQPILYTDYNSLIKDLENLNIKL